MKRVISFISFFVILSCTTVMANSEVKTNISVNGHDVNFTDDTGHPYVDENNRTQVPLRVTMESAGTAVSWDVENQMAIVEKNGTVIKVPIGENYIFVNDEKIATDTQAIILNGRTYLPIRKVLEELDFVVDWDETYKTVYAVNYGDFVNDDGQFVNKLWENAKTAQDIIDAIKASIDHERLEDQMGELAEQKYIDDFAKKDAGKVMYYEWYDEYSLKKEGLMLDIEWIYRDLDSAIVTHDDKISLTIIDTGEVIFSEIILSNSLETEYVFNGITVKKGGSVQLKGSDLYNLGYIKGFKLGGE